MQVLTTFDPRVQRAAESALEEVFATKVKSGSKAQAAIVVMSPDGAVRAIVGGRDLGNAEGQFNRATQAMRQPGSSFKPFVYLAALEAGYTPQTPVVDEPITIGNWSPRNYSGNFSGQMTLAQAVAQSTNTVAAYVADQIGRDMLVRCLVGLRYSLLIGVASAGFDDQPVPPRKYWYRSRFRMSAGRKRAT